MEKLYMDDFPGTKYRVNLIRESDDSYEWPPLSNPKTVFDFIKPLEDKDREYFVAIFLNAKNVPLGVHLVSIGDLTASTVHPRESFKAAILASACSVVFAHNHPSGNPDPSGADIKITQKLKEAGDLLGITVFDHIIVGRDCYHSFRESGQI
ncbi:MAG: DNA repair protein RadC [Desulfobacterales bacterium CG23_combo_of_CG06-09_8_20_14_all_51_8]|nr:MAG: DNA repair protein RadC [Desulfobacterales bacterium CG23_combo_of_CG06-09_8_20_14_all_51_8]